MCFDNGHYRSKIREKFRLNKDNFSRGVRYRLDQEKKTVRQIWQYGKERGEEFFSSYIGNVEFYGEGHLHWYIPAVSSIMESTLLRNRQL